MRYNFGLVDDIVQHQKLAQKTCSRAFDQQWTDINTPKYPSAIS